MKTKVEMWTVAKLLLAREEINPKPAFQRGPAWSDRHRQLLVDSMLRGYDIPKFYLNCVDQSHSGKAFRYEVADGQQRLRAILDFFDNKYRVDGAAPIMDGGVIGGKLFSELPEEKKTTLRNYNLTVTLIEGATKAELQALFARLQMGVVLNPPELRNALCSVIGAVIEVAAVTHPFFSSAKIPDNRFKRQDYLSHALALAAYGNAEDLKASLLKRLYEDGLTQYDQTLVAQAYTILDWLHAFGDAAKKRLRRKWCFVDVFDLLRRHYDEIAGHGGVSSLCEFQRAYVDFDEKRRSNTGKPERLLREKMGRPLYNYTTAFKTTPAVKGNITLRRAAMDSCLGMYLKGSL